MKKKIIASALILSMVFGGTTMASASVNGAQAVESKVELIETDKSEKVQPMIWAAVGRGVASAVGFFFGYEAASGKDQGPVYEYDEIKTSFDY